MPGEDPTATKVSFEAGVANVEMKGKQQAPVLFVNHAEIAANTDEFCIACGVKLPDSPGMANASVTLVMTPTHAKLLLLALAGQVATFEQFFGTIETDFLKRLSPEHREHVLAQVKNNG